MPHRAPTTAPAPRTKTTRASAPLICPLRHPGRWRRQAAAAVAHFLIQESRALVGHDPGVVWLDLLYRGRLDRADGPHWPADVFLACYLQLFPTSVVND